MENKKNGHVLFATTVIVLNQISPVKNPKSKLCTGKFNFKNDKKYRLINLWAHFVVPLNERMHRKGRHVHLKLFLRFRHLFYFYFADCVE